MREFTRAEALAFVDATRIVLNGKAGFKFHVEKLEALATYIESIADENEEMKAYIDSAGLTDSYESFRTTR